ncbi:MAG: leucine-rich repeat domain-containing protein [Clostridia bacterium]|nr:leucine-rich repeat domain-containing protein [Clostridia bacterium]
MKYLKLAALIVLILCAAALLYAIITYETKVDYTVLNETITACTTNAKKLVVPRSIDGSSVTAIGNRAFSENSTMISVEISDGIIELKDESFYNCTTLREVFIPKSVVYISPTAFAGCPVLTKIEVDFDNRIYESFNGVLFKAGKKELVYFPVGFIRSEYYIPHGTMIISEKAFYKCPLYTAYIPATVTRIENYAFADSTNMETISLPANLMYLGENVFAGNGMLHSINIGAGVEIQPNSVGSMSFYEQYQIHGAGTYVKTGNDQWEYVSDKD